VNENKKHGEKSAKKKLKEKEKKIAIPKSKKRNKYGK